MTGNEPLYGIVPLYYVITGVAVYAACPEKGPRNCDACDDRAGPFLCADSSGGEYGCVVLCEACIRKAFDAARGKT